MSHHLKPSRYIVTSDALSLAGQPGQWRVIFSTRSGAVLVLPEATWRIVEAAAIDHLPTSTRGRLVSAGMLVPDSEDELDAVVRENLAAIASYPVLYEVIQPTAWCQLDCTYCGQEHSDQHLSPADQDKVIGRLDERLRSGEYTHLKIGWFGAEPLAGLSVIRRLSPRLRALADAHGCSYSARIVTNGLALTGRVVTELVQLGITEAEVTLDGTATAHDARRPTKTGRGSYTRIFEHVRQAAVIHGMKVVVRCNVDQHNADTVGALARALVSAELADKVSFYTSPVYSWGNDAHRGALSPVDYARQEMEWLALQMRLGFSVGLVPPRRKIVCMSVQRDAEVVDAHGTTFNCTEVPYVPAYGDPSVYALTFHRSGGAPSVAAAHHEPLALRNFNEAVLAGTQTDCAECRMLPVCGGQCPKAWQEGHAPCPPAKYNMPERLNLLFALHHEHALPHHHA